MVGLLLTFAFSVCAMFAVRVAAWRWLDALDPAERYGVAGLIGLAIAGYCGLLGIIRGSLPNLVVVPVLIVLLTLVIAYSKNRIRTAEAIVELRFKAPEFKWKLVLASCLLLSLVPLVAALAPPDMMDWDSLAYHFAAPKLWLHRGEITFIPFIHQSNFPFLIENLYLWGLSWGGESGAKGFTLVGFGFGMLAVFGIARRWYGTSAAWWSLLAFCSVPVLLWESGTGYVDAVHGLFAAFGTCYCAELAYQRLSVGARSITLPLAVAMLAGAISSKYTGLQTLTACVLLLLGFGLVGRSDRWRAIRSTLILAVSALIIASPWYIRNMINTGNPVYPFLYEHLGGRGWDQWRADIYREEQQTFGVGKTPRGRDARALPHAVFGLAYQPGRYINPLQEQGGGVPMGALGLVVLVSGVAWLARGRPGTREGFLLGAIVIGLVFWFFLSQQSRYLTGSSIILAVLFGQAVVGKRMGLLLAALCVSQAIYSFWLLKTNQLDDQLPVVLGRESRDEYLTKRVPFFGASMALNESCKDGKVALYDEVFGYFLDVPYFWANPGHSTFIPYESLVDGLDYAAWMKSHGFTHAYVNLAYQTPESRALWIGETPFRLEAWSRSNPDLSVKWIGLLLDAEQKGLIVRIQAFRRSILFKIQ